MLIYISNMPINSSTTEKLDLAKDKPILINRKMLNDLNVMVFDERQLMFVRNELFELVKQYADVKSIPNQDLLNVCEHYDVGIEENVRDVFGRDVPVFDVEIE